MYHVRLLYRPDTKVQGKDLHAIAERVGVVATGMLPQESFIARNGDNTQFLFQDSAKALEFMAKTIDLEYILSAGINTTDII